MWLQCNNSFPASLSHYLGTLNIRVAEVKFIASRQFMQTYPHGLQKVTEKATIYIISSTHEISL